MIASTTAAPATPMRTALPCTSTALCCARHTHLSVCASAACAVVSVLRGACLGARFHAGAGGGWCASAGGSYDDASHATRDPCLEGAEFDLPPLDGALWTVRTASALGDHAPSAAPFRLVLGLPRTCVPVRPHTAMCRDRCCGRSGFPLAVAKAVSAHTMQVC